MKYFKVKILFICFICCLSPKLGLTQQDFNLDFELLNKDRKAIGWESITCANDQPYFSFLSDSVNIQNGKYSMSIEADSSVMKENYAYLKCSIPINVKGKKIVFKCFIKTKDIPTEGSANMFMRIYNNNLESRYLDLETSKITGTTDWREYSIELPLNSNDRNISLALQLKGKGKVWYDNMRLYVDGISIEEVTRKNTLKENTYSYDSKVKLTTITTQQISILSLLGKIWGFLKYHHPSIAQGKYDWDFELFKIIPLILDTKTNKVRDEVLLNWIENFGEILPCLECSNEPIDDIKVKPDFRWINTNTLSQALIDKLQFIHRNHNLKNYHYIAKNIIGNPAFINESPYYGMILPDAGFRLLALFRFWNMIEYFFPYKYAINEDWNSIMDKFIPKMISAKDTLTYRLTLSELLASIHDTHAKINFADIYWTQQFEGFYRVPAQVIFIDNQAVIAGFYGKESAQQTQLNLGDILLEVDGKSVDSIVKEQLKITHGSNETAKLLNISFRLLKGFKPGVSLKIKRNKEIKNLKLERVLSFEGSKRTWLPIPDSCYRFITPDIGYIYLGKIEINKLPIIFEKFKNTKGIIIDIRTYPSQFVVFALSHYLLPQRKPFVKFSMIDINHPGVVKWDRLEYIGMDNLNYYKGKIAILVNENTLSQAEYTAMAFKTAPRAVVIGSQTLGADGDVSIFTLPGNAYSYISGIGIYYPDGKETQRVGIVPDIIVHPTINGIKAGKDEVLEKAIDEITKE